MHSFYILNMAIWHCINSVFPQTLQLNSPPQMFPNCIVKSSIENALACQFFVESFVQLQKQQNSYLHNIVNLFKIKACTLPVSVCLVIRHVNLIPVGHWRLQPGVLQLHHLRHPHQACEGGHVQETTVAAAGDAITVQCTVVIKTLHKCAWETIN